MTSEQKKAIDACKEQVAIDAGYAHKDGRDWHRATFSVSRERLDELYDRAIQLYGEQCRKEARILDIKPATPTLTKGARTSSQCKRN